MDLQACALGNKGADLALPGSSLPVPAECDPKLGKAKRLSRVPSCNTSVRRVLLLKTRCNVSWFSKFLLVGKPGMGLMKLALSHFLKALQCE